MDEARPIQMSSWVLGYLAWPVSDLVHSVGSVGPCLPIRYVGRFSCSVRFFCFRTGFFVLSPVLGQKVTARVRFVLLWVKNYDSYQYVALVGSIEFFFGRVGSGDTCSSIDGTD